jgi:translocation and assembly module TamB
MWGDGTAQVVIENQYVTIDRGVVRLDDSEILAEGRFSLGYPRRDQGDEIDATFRVSRRDLQSVRHAFVLDDYPIAGRLSGVFTLTGAYERPIGFGAMTIEEGVAYGEPFEKGTASVRLDGSGIRLDGVHIAAAGLVSGAAFIGWDSTYAFDMDGRGFPVERLSTFAFPRAQPTGTLAFSATGRGTFDDPRNDVRFQIQDLFVADEGVGEVSGTLLLRGTELTGEVSVASPRLAMTGTGRIALAARQEAELTFRFHDTSLDPYVRLFVPRLSPFTTAVATGTVRVTGALSAFDRLVVDASVDSLDMRLFDYAVRNARPIRLALAEEVVRVDDLQLVGEDTQLTIGGTVAIARERIALKAEGDANLGILQGFFRNVRGSGHARLAAAIDGPLYEPTLLGRATITDGRVRHFSLPNSLDGINGSVEFDSRGIGLDDLTAVMGGGRVQFGGRIGLEGYQPGELSVTARGDGMQLRYPAGVRSTVDADLTVRGSFVAPTLGGVVTVRSATWTERFDPTGGLFDFGGGGDGPAPAAPASTGAVPLRFDLAIVVPSTLRIENNLARLVASADLQLRGTYDRPVLFGRAEVDRGEIMFEGRRYLVTRGAIDFNNPSRIEPFFDVEAETRVRVPGQTYRVIVSAAGTMARMQPQLSSDPPLPAPDVLALLFSDVRRSADVELRALQNPNEVQTDILAARATQLLAAPISSEVGRVVEQTFGVDTFQLTPSLIDPYSYSTSPRVNPSARVTIGKRISDRVYLTFSRSLSSSLNDQILLLEYDESDRLSWILSRNEDQTYAVEVRVRHAF